MCQAEVLWTRFNRNLATDQFTSTSAGGIVSIHRIFIADLVIRFFGRIQVSRGIQTDPVSAAIRRPRKATESLLLGYSY